MLIPKSCVTAKISYVNTNCLRHGQHLICSIPIGCVMVKISYVKYLLGCVMICHVTERLCLFQLTLPYYRVNLLNLMVSKSYMLRSVKIPCRIHIGCLLAKFPCLIPIGCLLAKFPCLIPIGCLLAKILCLIPIGCLLPKNPC